MTYIWKPDTYVYGWMRDMVNPLSTHEALCFPLYETYPGIPLGLSLAAELCEVPLWSALLLCWLKQFPGVWASAQTLQFQWSSWSASLPPVWTAQLTDLGFTGILVIVLSFCLSVPIIWAWRTTHSDTNWVSCFQMDVSFSHAMMPSPIDYQLHHYYSP